VGGFTDWTQVSAGQFHSVGLRANGTAWAWGVNLDGQLGDFSGSNASKSSPVSVVGGFTDWIQLSASLTHTSGVRANGTAWAWGNNSGGKLGDNSITNKSSPVSVVGGIVDWIQISAGSVHTSGVRANGTAWAWGNNSGGQLGDNTTVGKSSPVSVIGGFVDWIQISAGQSAGGPFSLGLRANGTAWAWGNGGSGKLGDGTAVGKSSPVSVVGGFTDWLQISGGNNHSVGIRANGTAWAWGANGSGEFGNGIASLGSTSPVSAAVGFTDWVQLNASAFAVSFGIRG
jgi:alpha-tubulin suppressor-like RCC1 family protein